MSDLKGKCMELQDMLIKTLNDQIANLTEKCAAEAARADTAEATVLRLRARIDKLRGIETPVVAEPEENHAREQKREAKKAARATEESSAASAAPRQRGKCKACGVQITGFLCATESCVAERNERAAEKKRKAAEEARKAAAPPSGQSALDDYY